MNLDQSINCKYENSACFTESFTDLTEPLQPAANAPIIKPSKASVQCSQSSVFARQTLSEASSSVSVTTANDFKTEENGQSSNTQASSIVRSSASTTGTISRESITSEKSTLIRPFTSPSQWRLQPDAANKHFREQESSLSSSTTGRTITQPSGLQPLCGGSSREQEECNLSNRSGGVQSFKANEQPGTPSFNGFSLGKQQWPPITIVEDTFSKGTEFSECCGKLSPEKFQHLPSTGGHVTEHKSETAITSGPIQNEQQSTEKSISRAIIGFTKELGQSEENVTRSSTICPSSERSFSSKESLQSCSKSTNGRGRLFKEGNERTSPRRELLNESEETELVELPISRRQTEFRGLHGSEGSCQISGPPEFRRSRGFKNERSLELKGSPEQEGSPGLERLPELKRTSILKESSDCKSSPESKQTSGSKGWSGLNSGSKFARDRNVGGASKPETPSCISGSEGSPRLRGITEHHFQGTSTEHRDVRQAVPLTSIQATSCRPVGPKFSNTAEQEPAAIAQSSSSTTDGWSAPRKLLTAASIELSLPSTNQSTATEKPFLASTITQAASSINDGTSLATSTFDGDFRLSTTIHRETITHHEQRRAPSVAGRSSSTIAGWPSSSFEGDASSSSGRASSTVEEGLAFSIEREPFSTVEGDHLSTTEKKSLYASDGGPLLIDDGQSLLSVIGACSPTFAGTLSPTCDGRSSPPIAECSPSPTFTGLSSPAFSGTLSSVISGSSTCSTGIGILSQCRSSTITDGRLLRDSSARSCLQSSVKSTELSSIRSSKSLHATNGATCKSEETGSPGVPPTRVSDATSTCSVEFGLQPEGKISSVKEGVELGLNARQTPATTKAAKGILSIDKAVVHRICSGQVVVNLATAVKELLENSLDAGSHSVEVRLTHYGATSIVVIDDGPGVHPRDFEALALKHHTSKLQDFSDLTSVTTFGFRGEALSSLCALSQLTVCTRNTSQTLGTFLEYDSNGRLTAQKPVPRQHGTTVTLCGLFSSLPVRKCEFDRNLKKEYHKLLQVLNSYAIISTNVRLQVSNQLDSSTRRHTVLATSSHHTVRENIVAVLGAKQSSSLLLLPQCSPDADILQQFNITNDASDAAALFKLEGLVSSCRHGAGRAAPDRQYYYVNSRPCDPIKVSRLVNEVYHSYNRHQYPCVVMNITTRRQGVDVNLTPDKRGVLLHRENLLLALVKSSLQQLYEEIPHSVPLNQLTLTKSPASRNTLAPYKVMSSASPSPYSPTPLASPTYVTPLRPSPSCGNSTAQTLVGAKCGRSSSTELSSPVVKHVDIPIAQKDTSCTSNLALSKATINTAALGVSESATGNPVEDTWTHTKRIHFSAHNLKTSKTTDKSATYTDTDTLICKNSNTLDMTNNEQNTDVINKNNFSQKRANSAFDGDQLNRKDKQPRLDLNLADDKENNDFINNVSDTGQSVPLIESCGNDSEDNAQSCDAVLPSITDQADMSFEELQDQGRQPPEPADAGSVSSPATLRKDLKVHSATDNFLTRLLAAKKDIGISNKSLKSCVAGMAVDFSVRNSLKRFRFDHTPEPFLVGGANTESSGTNDLQVVFDSSQEHPDAIEYAANGAQLPPATIGDSGSFTCSDEHDGIIIYDDNEDIEAMNSINVPVIERRCKVVDVSLSVLQKALDGRCKQQDQKTVQRHFHAKIAPSDNRAAEEELNKVLSKDMFNKMQVIGQFNLGFIITQLHSDLFIIDQHATDEKYNFETLQETCVLRYQPLIMPQALELTPSNEAILLDNISVFVANGFQFDVDELGALGQRVKLKSVPQSRNWTFDKDDIDELIFMLADSPGSMCRPSRVRDMFASRACRMSVMVGTALTPAQMRELVDHMGEIEQPWNCPHGRPTVRHLVNLDMITCDADNRNNGG